MDYAAESHSRRALAEGYLVDHATLEHDLRHYLPPGVDRADPRVSPLRAAQLRGLPPTCVHTAEFDPLRDEGAAYANALAAAGVPVTHIEARGHTHTSLTMVDVVLSGAPVRAEIADALRGLSRVEAAPAV
jgi:acetyl esterase/lipase